MIYRDSEKKQGYTIVSNSYIRDVRLSLKAKGLLTIMLSMNDKKWNYSIKGLTSICKETYNTIFNILKELEKYHYLYRYPVRNKKGYIVKWVYDIYEIPLESKKQILDNQIFENEVESINNKINNDNNLDKKDKTLNFITNELIERKFIEKGDLNLLDYNNFFNKLLEDYDYLLILTVVNYVVTHMKYNKGFDEQGNIITDKYNYFRISVLNNIALLKNKETNSFSWEECDL